MAQTKACTRCGARCVVEATRLCLACGHEGSPGADRIDAIGSAAWRDTVVLPAEFATPDSRRRFEDEEESA